MIGKIRPVPRSGHINRGEIGSLLVAILLLVATVAVGFPLAIDMVGGSSHEYTFIQDIAEPDDVTAVDFSPDNDFLFAGTNDGEVVIDTSDWSQVTTIGGLSDTPNVEFSHSGERVAVADQTGTLRIVNATDWSIETDISAEFATDAAWSPDDDRLALTWNEQFGDGGVRIYNTTDWSVEQTLSNNDYDFNGVPEAVDFSPDGNQVAVADQLGNNEIFIFDTGTWNNIQTFQAPDHTESVVYTRSSDDMRVAYAAGNDVVVRDADDWSIESTIDVPGGSDAVELDWSPFDVHLAVGTEGNNMEVFDTADYSHLQTLSDQSEDVRGVAYSDNGDWLAGAGLADFPVYSTSGVEQPIERHSIDLQIENWMDHGTEQTYTIEEFRTDPDTGENVTVDVTDEATITSFDPTNLTVDQTNNTLTATSNEDFAGQIEVGVELEGNQDNETVTIANRSLPHIDILPPEHRLPAIFGPGIGDRTDATEFWPGAIQIQYLFAITFIGALIANRTGGFAGLAVIEIGVLMGYPLDFVSLGTVIASIFFTVFLFTQLASVTEFSGR